MVGFWKNKRVLVTGSNGFLGSKIEDALLVNGANVVSVVRSIVHRDITNSVPKNLRLIVGNITDLDLMERVLHDEKIEIVFHLAAQAIVTTANQHPYETFESNIRGSYTLLEAIRRYDSVQSVVFASSDKAYGEPTEIPYKEDHELKGQHPYDVSKSCADLLASAYINTFQIPIIITRCGNLFGPGDRNLNRLIPEVITSVLQSKAIKLRSDGSHLRDFLYVDDAVEAYLTIAKHLYQNNSLSGAFNISREEPIEIMEVVKKILALMDSEDHEIKILGTATSEIKRQWLDAEKIRTLMNWEAKTEFQVALEETIKWYSKEYGMENSFK